MDAAITNAYGNKLRVRVCGLCWQNDALLLVNHSGITNGDFWAPPGGGLEFGETADQRLKKEFLEETGLNISIGKFMFACELISHPLHAIELFFQVSSMGGVAQRGYDPEVQIIKETRFLSLSDIDKIPLKSIHGIFSVVQSPLDLKTLTGFFRL